MFGNKKAKTTAEVINKLTTMIDELGGVVVSQYEVVSSQNDIIAAAQVKRDEADLEAAYAAKIRDNLNKLLS